MTTNLAVVATTGRSGALLPSRAAGAPAPAWAWPLDLPRYDRSAALTSAERAALDLLGDEARGWWFRPGRATAQRRAAWATLERLLRPLRDAREALDLPHRAQRVNASVAVGILLRECGRAGQSFWAWAPATWVRVLGTSNRAFVAAYPGSRGGSVRHCAVALAYLLRCFTALDDLGRYRRFVLAGKVFGRARVAAALARLDGVLAGWGYVPADEGSAFARVLSGALLAQGSPCLEALSPAVLDGLARGAAREDQTMAHRLRRGLAALGFAAPPAGRTTAGAAEPGIDPVWESWVRRWEATSTLAPLTRRNVRGRLLRLGRWLHGAHPDAADPATWTRERCAAAVAAVDRMRVGEYAQRHDCLGDRVGRPLSASAKENYLTTLRQFFRDLQEWGWIPVRFTPARTFATPRSVRAVLGPDPRVLADDLWAKLLWAGLHLEEADLAPLHDGGAYYPLAFVRALAVTWLFSGLRSDELVRLRVGCVRWQPAAPAGGAEPGAGAAARGAVGAPPPVCLLDVPVHKTGTAFTKPVDAVVGQTIAAWEAVRPAQPALPDAKTGEPVAVLFCFRAKPLRTRYVNLRLIPLLCRKAGLPLADARGRITSHRARATIATQLYNAKEPMTLFELQAWLGHRTPRSTQYYARLTPTTLAKAYTDAGYFARNVRTIEVLLDRDAVQTGAAGAGAPWQYFDLGHGHCTYSFFEQCPHRLACARCDFYVPKDSTRAQLLEAKANLQRMRLEIPLTEGELAAVEDGTAAVEHLLERLADTPTPAGPTPRDLHPTFTAFIPRDAVARPARRT